MKLRITWIAPFDNFKDIVQYEVLIANSDSTEWISNTQYCDGADAAIMASSRCDIPMKEILRQEPYLLQFD